MKTFDLMLLLLVLSLVFAINLVVTSYVSELKPEEFFYNPKIRAEKLKSAEELEVEIAKEIEGATDERLEEMCEEYISKYKKLDKDIEDIGEKIKLKQKELVNATEMKETTKILTLRRKIEHLNNTKLELEREQSETQLFLSRTELAMAERGITPPSLAIWGLFKAMLTFDKIFDFSGTRVKILDDFSEFATDNHLYLLVALPFWGAVGFIVMDTFRGVGKATFKLPFIAKFDVDVGFLIMLVILGLVIGIDFVDTLWGYIQDIFRGML